MHDVVMMNGPTGVGAFLIEGLVPLGLMFLLVVAPVWLWLHYRRGGGSKLAEADRQAIASLARTAERLEARLAAVERAVVDAEMGASNSDMKV